MFSSGNAAMAPHAARDKTQSAYPNARFIAACASWQVS